MTTRLSQWLSRYFKLSESNTTVRTELPAMGYTYSQSLVVVFISGVLFIVITKVGLREAIIRAIPDSVINAVTPRRRPVHHHHRPEKQRSGGEQPLHAGESGRFFPVAYPGADLSGLCGALVALIGLIFIARYAFIALG